MSVILNHLKRKDNVGKHYYDPEKTLGIDRNVKKLIEEDVFASFRDASLPFGCAVALDVDVARVGKGYS